MLDYYRQQLITAGDQFDSVSEIAVRMSLGRDKEDVVATDFNDMPFAEFLESPDGKKILTNGEKVATELTKKIRKRILEAFDETAELHSSEGCYTIRELVDAWGFLSSLSYCAERWTRSMIRRSRAAPFRTYAAVVKKDMLIALLSARLKISNQRADELLRQFMIREQNGDDWDLFYRPLVPLEGNDIGVASSFIGLSRFYRNVFSIAIRDTDIDLSARGFKPLAALRGNFLRAGLRAGTNKAVCVGGREITDVDFFFLVDRILFVAQVKVLLEPDSAHEKWKVMTKLNRAGEQLQRTMDSLPSLVGDLLDDLGVPHEERKHIGRPFPFILCNIEHTTGFRLGGFPVVHFGLLEMLVRGGRIGMLAVEGGTVKHVGFRSVIRGSLPTGADFVNLIQDPRPYFRAMFRPPTEFQHVNFTSGSFVIQAPGFRFTADNKTGEASSPLSSKKT